MSWTKQIRRYSPFAVLLFLGLNTMMAAAQSPKSTSAGRSKPQPEECQLLEDIHIAGRMDGLLRQLAIKCDRSDLIGAVRQAPNLQIEPGEGVPNDVQVNDSSGDSGSSTTQSETSIAVNEVTGTYCSGFNDSFSGIGAGSFTGFSRSIDGGATWSDQGALPAPSSGDPSIVWRKSDEKFYFAALRSGGLGVWRSDDDCVSFVFVSAPASGNDDKEILAVDNHPLSPFYGRLYLAWTDFGSGDRIYSVYSDDGGVTWSSQLAVSAAGADVQGAWPTVAPNGDVYIGWVRWNPFPSGPIDIEIVRSTDGGVSFSPVTNPITGEVNPRDSGATASCGRPALNENIRYLPSPQIVVGSDGVVHVVYSYDPDGFNTGDVVDVFYRRSTDNGTNWGTEVRLNDDATTNDQYFPTLSVGPENIVVATWYDRRLDPLNELQDTYKAVSPDGGVTWLANERVSDVSSPIYLDPELATCYHGDYDQIAQDTGFALLQWSDDRNVVGMPPNDRNDPDVWFELEPVSNDFVLIGTPTNIDICTPSNAVYTIDVLQFQGFSEDINLTVSGEPGGTTVTFGSSMVIPPATTTMTISDTGGATAGSYSMIVTGTSDPSMIVHDATVGLNVFTAMPDAPILTTPVDDATDVSEIPTLEWNAATQASSFEVELATDAGFSNIVFSTTTSDIMVQVAMALDPLTEYFWRVRGVNTCSTGSNSSVFSFTTRPIPPILLVDDDDNNPDVRQTYEDALNALGLAYDVWDTNNTDDEPTANDLAAHSMVIWFTGDEFGGFAGPGAASETALGGWLDNNNGCLFISSQDYHFDRGLTQFMQDYLGAGTMANDSGDYTSVTGVAGSIFDGQGPFTLTYPFSDWSDPITPNASGTLAFEGNNQNGAAVERNSAQRGLGEYQTVFFAFPWEAITNAADRQNVLQTIVDSCPGFGTIFADGFENGNISSWSLSQN